MELTQPLTLAPSCDGATETHVLSSLSLSLAQPAFGMAEQGTFWRAFPPGALVFDASGVVDGVPFSMRRPTQEPVYIRALDGWSQLQGPDGAWLEFAVPCGVARRGRTSDGATAPEDRRRTPSTMILRSVLVLSFLALACDSSDATPSTAKSEAKPVDARPADAKQAETPKVEEVPEPEWSSLAIEPTSVEVDGVKFKVSVPKDLKLEIKPAKGSFPGYANWTWPHSFDGPSFTVREVSAPRDLAAAVRGVESGKYKATHQEEIDGGFLVAAIEDTKKYIHVEHTKKGPGDKWYQYSVMQRTKEPIADIDARQAWMLAAAKTLAFE
jgi:hypothetical protein